ncbi:MAG: peptidoglycan editing factor PgeF [Alphaproteobacteria bacterium]|nr:peptidoglycan editing factor PgeF [Alphaproteobacteria bacterium]MBU3975117.1 peptidoglycan editing factor PgeF [Alphaproteobacteria bacterium]MBU4038710.1 peptidoglycan editing factor PgeF [Alphaproteobacteria bacterium]MBU4135385.1 peptidoglycan editing factor PgeF [Alphaproteobacteria bacterium]
MALAPITHPLLDRAGVRHGFFTRAGGVSRGLYEGLNTGVGSSDDPADVAENRRRVAEHLGGVAGDLAACFQIHSAVCRVAEAGWNGARPEGDAVVTATPAVICAVLTADCAPILLADPEAGVVGATHAGWKGALDGVVQSTVAAMQALGAEPRRMVAVVGPCIAQASYEVGADFQERFDRHDPGGDRFFAPGETVDKRLFDLPGFVLWRLEQAGVADAAWTGDDTRTDPARFYSNRRAYLNGEADFGRLMSAISLG